MSSSATTTDDAVDPALEARREAARAYKKPRRKEKAILRQFQPKSRPKVPRGPSGFTGRTMYCRSEPVKYLLKERVEKETRERRLEDKKDIKKLREQISAELWKALPEDDQKKWEDMAAKDKGKKRQAWNQSFTRTERHVTSNGDVWETTFDSRHPNQMHTRRALISKAPTDETPASDGDPATQFDSALVSQVAEPSALTRSSPISLGLPTSITEDQPQAHQSATATSPSELFVKRTEFGVTLSEPPASTEGPAIPIYELDSQDTRDSIREDRDDICSAKATTDAQHCQANFSSDSPSPMNFGRPNDDTRIVAEADSTPTSASDSAGPAIPYDVLFDRHTKTSGTADSTALSEAKTTPDCSTGDPSPKSDLSISPAFPTLSPTADAVPTVFTDDITASDFARDGLLSEEQGDSQLGQPEFNVDVPVTTTDAPLEVEFALSVESAQGFAPLAPLSSNNLEAEQGPPTPSARQDDGGVFTLDAEDRERTAFNSPEAPRRSERLRIPRESAMFLSAPAASRPKRKRSTNPSEDEAEVKRRRTSTRRVSLPSSAQPGHKPTSPRKSTSTALSKLFFPAPTPPWADKALQMFKSLDLESNWNILVRRWVTFEYSCGPRKPKSLPSNGRPPCVSAWFKYGRSPTYDLCSPAQPKVTTADLERDFHIWWANLQPSWRTRNDDGTWKQDKQFKKLEWDTLMMFGPTGMLTVVAALYFWAKVDMKEATAHGQRYWTCPRTWEAAVKDVAFVFTTCLPA